MENPVSAQKAPQGFTTETRELLEGTKENSILSKICGLVTPGKLMTKIYKTENKKFVSRPGC